MVETSVVVALLWPESLVRLLVEYDPGLCQEEELLPLCVRMTSLAAAFWVLAS